jgi:hypothetical protein
MNNKSGFALVAVLSLIATVAVVSFSTTFLTIRSVKTSENRRTHTQSKQNAESGLEIAKLYLQNEYAASKYTTLPVSMPDLTSDDPQIQFRIVYTPDNTTTPITGVQLSVTGTAPRDARYITETRLQVRPQPPSPNSITGIKALGIVDVNGNTGNKDVGIVNSQIHGNGGVMLKGDSRMLYWKCPPEQTAPPSLLNCTPLTSHADIPVTAASGLTTSCDVNSQYPNSSTGSYCSASKVATSQAVTIDNPPYITNRNALLTGVDTSGTPTSANMRGCDFLNQPIPATGGNNQTYCYTTDPGFSGTISDARIVLFTPKVEIASSVTFNNVRFWASGSLLTKGAMNLTSSDIYADGNLDLENDLSLPSGTSTIATHAAFTTKANMLGSTTTSSKLKVLAQGAITVNGNLEVGVSDQMVLEMWSGGSTTVNGSLSLRGGIQSRGDITLYGNLSVDSRSTDTNPPAGDSTRLFVLSRR